MSPSEKIEMPIARAWSLPRPGELPSYQAESRLGDETPLVLIVDAEPCSRQVLEVVLREMDFRTLQATDPLHAHQLIDKHSLDLILLDYDLPGMRGIELLERLKSNEATRDIPAIMITSADGDDVLARSFATGAVDYITKPFSPRVVQARAKAAVEAYRLQEELRTSKSRYRLALAAAQCGMWDWNVQDDHFYITQPLAHLLGLKQSWPKDLAEWLELAHANDRARVARALQDYVAGRTSELNIEYRVKVDHAFQAWFLCRGALIRDAHDGSQRVVGALIDITERKKAEIALQRSLREVAEARLELEEMSGRLHEQNVALRRAKSKLEAESRKLEIRNQDLEQISRIDPLTGALNRRTLMELFDQEWDRAYRYRNQLSCALLDIDFFKKVNDTHGHAAGDHIIRGVAETLMAHCRACDSVGRHGGEEFCILLPQTDETGAAEWAERVRKTIEQRSFDVDGKEISVRVSIGVCGWQRAGDPENLVHLADEALLLAKESGRNRVVSAAQLDDESIDPAENRRLGNLLTGFTAEDVMRTAVLCPKQTDSLHSVVEYFLNVRTGAAPVVDENGHFVGLISDQNVLQHVTDPGFWSNHIRDFMQKNAVEYDVSAPADEIFHFMSRASVRFVAITRDKKPVGLIGRASFLRWSYTWHGMQGTGDARHTERARWQNVWMAAEVLAHRSAELPDRLSQERHDFIPCVVGEISRIQELANDLLGHCQRISV